MYLACICIFVCFLALILYLMFSFLTNAIVKASNVFPGQFLGACLYASHCSFVFNTITHFQNLDYHSPLEDRRSYSPLKQLFQTLAVCTLNLMGLNKPFKPALRSGYWEKFKKKEQR